MSEQFLLTECLFVPGGFSDLKNQNNHNLNWKKLLGFRHLQEKFENEVCTWQQRSAFCTTLFSLAQNSVAVVGEIWTVSGKKWLFLAFFQYFWLYVLQLNCITVPSLAASLGCSSQKMSPLALISTM